MNMSWFLQNGSMLILINSKIPALPNYFQLALWLYLSQSDVIETIGRRDM